MLHTPPTHTLTGSTLYAMDFKLNFVALSRNFDRIRARTITFDSISITNDKRQHSKCVLCMHILSTDASNEATNDTLATHRRTHSPTVFYLIIFVYFTLSTSSLLFSEFKGNNAIGVCAICHMHASDSPPAKHITQAHTHTQQAVHKIQNGMKMQIQYNRHYNLLPQLIEFN